MVIAARARPNGPPEPIMPARPLTLPATLAISPPMSPAAFSTRRRVAADFEKPSPIFWAPFPSSFIGPESLSSIHAVTPNLLLTAITGRPDLHKVGLGDPQIFGDERRRLDESRILIPPPAGTWQDLAVPVEHDLPDKLRLHSRVLL